MSSDIRPASMQEMREFVNEYLKSRYPKSKFDNEVFDDDTIVDMFTEVNSKYVEWGA
jgi:hypothetical protein